MLAFLLDTNIAIYVIKHKPLEVRQKFIDATGRLAISSITLAELYHGVNKSTQREQSQRKVDDFCSRLEVIEYAEQAARHYGDIRAHLESIGRPIGVNDIHIAAHARSLGFTLVTNNSREFERVPGLLLENWVS
jgi:tRNA(fMet)-specific endonuclease VapC